MTALEYLRKNYAADLAYARKEYWGCRRRGLLVMTEYYRRQMVRAYIGLRGVRS
jgi:hypothetical protein